MNEMIFKRLIIFSIVFVQIFIAFNPARAMDSIVDDAPPVDESKPYIPVTADNLQDMTAQAAILIDATTEFFMKKIQTLRQCLQVRLR